MREAFTVISLYFLIALFMALALAFLLGDVIDDFYVALLGIDWGTTINGHMSTHIPVYRNATVFALALGIASPFGWWIAKVFQREAEYNPYEYPYNRGF